MINTVKGKALEVAEYLTPVLKVSGLVRDCHPHAWLCRDLGPGAWRVTWFSGGKKCGKAVGMVHGKRCSPYLRSYLAVP